MILIDPFSLSNIYVRSGSKKNVLYIGIISPKVYSADIISAGINLVSWHLVKPLEKRSLF